MLNCEWPAFACTYAFGFPTAASNVNAVCLKPCHGWSGFVIPAFASAFFT
jgi:hypothetical protein